MAARPQQAGIQAVTLPSPMGGVNAIAPVSAMSPADAIYAYNVVAAQYGMRVRDGWREWAVGVDGGIAVRQLIPYGGIAGDGSQDKLFATTVSGIWDVTDFNVTPTRVVTFPSPGGAAGYGSSLAHVDDAGVARLVYTDELNGYYTYTPGSGWTKLSGADVTGVDPATFAHCCVFKERLWFIQRGTSACWYLPIRSYKGAAKRFDFGNKFMQGGELAAIANWTQDGGQGIDNFLVAVSRQGDVLVYQGSDPDAAADSSGAGWMMRAQWSVGPVPAGRQFLTRYGGELLILSQAGVVPLSNILRGQDTANSDLYASRKISPLINADMATSRTSLGWSLTVHANRNLLIITTPLSAGGKRHQYVMFIPTAAWTVYRDIPMDAACVWQGSFFFTTSDGRVCIHTGTTDGVALNGTGGGSIAFSLLTSFQTLGAEGRVKRVQMVRPLFRSDSAAPVYGLSARFDYDFVEPPLGVGGGIVQASVWGPSGSLDVANWDQSYWSGSTVIAQRLQGAQGIGRAVAIALVGQATTDTTLVSFDVLFDVGGYL